MKPKARQCPICKGRGKYNLLINYAQETLYECPVCRGFGLVMACSLNHNIAPFQSFTPEDFQEARP